MGVLFVRGPAKRCFAFACLLKPNKPGFTLKNTTQMGLQSDSTAAGFGFSASIPGLCHGAADWQWLEEPEEEVHEEHQRLSGLRGRGACSNGCGSKMGTQSRLPWYMEPRTKTCSPLVDKF